jgi:ComF family protein
MDTIRSIYEAFCTLLFPRTDTARLVTEATSESVGRLLNPVTLSSCTTGLLPYRHPLIRSLIIEAKFHQNQTAYRRLAEILDDYIESISIDQSAFTDAKVILVPVPLGKKREKERGYNQVEAVLKYVSRDTDVHLLVRSEETRPQTSLSRRERLLNVVGAFRVEGTIDPHALYVVIDDVTTTGATLHEACETLLKAGASTVYGVALAH